MVPGGLHSQVKKNTGVKCLLLVKEIELEPGAEKVKNFIVAANYPAWVNLFPGINHWRKDVRNSGSLLGRALCGVSRGALRATRKQVIRETGEKGG